MPIPKNKKKITKKEKETVKKIPAKKPKKTKVKKTKIISSKISKKGESKKSIVKSNALSDNDFKNISLDDIYDFKEEGVESEKETSKKEFEKAPKIHLNLYRKIAFTFIILTVGLLLAIFYFAFIKVTIYLTPAQETFNNNIVIDVYDIDKYKNIEQEHGASGVIKNFEIEASENYPATGKKIIDEEITGKVSIINKYTKNQPLVATTRLLSPEGKLYRIKETVNVPVGGSVEVEIYADKLDPEMAIGPTHFTIPGLWSGIQDKIYAQSAEAFQYKENADKFILEADIENAMINLKQEIAAKAKKEINEMYANYDNIIYEINEDSIEKTIQAKVGEKKNQFLATAKAIASVIAFNKNTVNEFAYAKMLQDIPDDKKLIKINQESFKYNLNNYNTKENTASVGVSFSAEVSLSNEIGAILEKEKLLGLSKTQVEQYLSGRGDIENFRVEFFPSFIQKVPKLIDRIIIITSE